MEKADRFWERAPYFGWIERGTLTLSRESQKMLARENLRRIKQRY